MIASIISWIVGFAIGRLTADKKDYVRSRFDTRLTRSDKSWSVVYEEDGKSVFETFPVVVLKNQKLIDKIELIYGR